MREIKFRSAHYDNDGKFTRFSYWGRIDHKQRIRTDFSVFTSPSQDNKSVIKTDEQYTGLKDCKGKEIYEGDIIEFDAKEWGSNKGNKFVVEWYDYDAEWSLGGGSTGGDMEWRTVIGNIHENPELLEAK